jgi:hypothetical protein
MLAELLRALGVAELEQASSAQHDTTSKSSEAMANRRNTARTLALSAFAVTPPFTGLRRRWHTA